VVDLLYCTYREAVPVQRVPMSVNHCQKVCRAIVKPIALDKRPGASIVRTRRLDNFLTISNSFTYLHLSPIVMSFTLKRATLY
jgi:hypothetical protein